MTNSEEYSETLLVEKLSKGDIRAFNDLFKRYGNRLYRFAYRYLKSEAEAENLVQEVFTRVWEKHRSLNKDLSFKSYLFTIAFNIIKKHFISLAKRDEYLNNSLLSELDMHTADEISYSSLSAYIKGVVDKLPEKRREIFIRSRYDGQSIDEIAADLNISHKTVENQITQALKTLRESLKKDNIALILFLYLFIF